MVAHVRASCLAAIGLAALFAGCGANGGPIASQMNQGTTSGQSLLAMTSSQFAVDTTTQRVVYVDSFDGRPGQGEILVYPAGLGQKNPPPTRTIFSGAVRPLGMWVDSAGTLYAANVPQGAPSTGVKEFHPGSTAPFRTLVEDLVYPEAVAVGADGTVYVNQRQSPVDAHVGDFVTIFPPGSVHPSTTLTLPIAGYAPQADEMAFDKHGNLLVEGFTFNHGLHIFKVTPGTFAISELHLNLGGLDGPGLAVDGAGNIYVSGFYAGEIAVFPPGSNNASRIIPQSGQQLAVLPDGTLYVAGGYGIAEYKAGASSPTNTFNLPAGIYPSGGIAVGPAN